MPRFFLLWGFHYADPMAFSWILSLCAPSHPVGLSLNVTSSKKWKISRFKWFLLWFVTAFPHISTDSFNTVLNYFGLTMCCADFAFLQITYQICTYVVNFYDYLFTCPTRLEASRRPGTCWNPGLVSSTEYSFNDYLIHENNRDENFLMI